MENIPSIQIISVIMLLSILAITAIYCMVMIYERNRQDKLHDLMSLYNQIWTGHKYDRIHAWYRVIAHLEAWNYDPSMIEECRKEIKLLKKEMYSSSDKKWKCGFKSRI